MFGCSYQFCQKNWGFDMSETFPHQVDSLNSDSPSGKCFVWCGAKDNSTTPAMAEYLVRKVPGSELRVVDDVGHLVLFTKWKEIIGELVDDPIPLGTNVKKKLTHEKRY